MKKIILILIILISINTFCFARYYENLKTFSGKAQIAEPIFKVIPLQEKSIVDVNRNTARKRICFLCFKFRKQK